MNKPRKYDAVLGGNNPPPTNAAVLGGGKQDFITLKYIGSIIIPKKKIIATLYNPKTEETTPYFVSHRDKDVCDEWYVKKLKGERNEDYYLDENSPLEKIKYQGSWRINNLPFLMGQFYSNPVYIDFVLEIESYIQKNNKPHLNPFNYRGRYFYEGPAALTSESFDRQDAIRTVSMKVHFDQLGKHDIFYPRD